MASNDMTFHDFYGFLKPQFSRLQAQTCQIVQHLNLLMKMAASAVSPGTAALVVGLLRQLKSYSLAILGR